MTGTGKAPQRLELTVCTDLGDVAVRVTGSGSGSDLALLLLHANPGDSRDYDEIVPVLGKHYTTVVVDWPGYGSSTVTDPDRVSTGELVAVAEQVMAALSSWGIRRLAIVGNSVGGLVGFRLAQRRPAEVIALVLVSPAGFVPQSRFMRIFSRDVMGRPAVARWLVGPLARGYLGRLGTTGVRATYTRARRLRRDPRTLAVHCALWRSFAAPTFNLTAVAEPPTQPTLLIWGRRDPVGLAPITARRAQNVFPHARTVLLPTGHEPFNEQPDLFLACVLPFLRRYATTRKGAPDGEAG
jgi:pimeloyl-ACP methyl ester carboxylesterase